jgi:hypothetical protein
VVQIIEREIYTADIRHDIVKILEDDDLRECLRLETHIWPDMERAGPAGLFLLAGRVTEQRVVD